MWDDNVRGTRSTAASGGGSSASYGPVPFLGGSTAACAAAAPPVVTLPLSHRFDLQSFSLDSISMRRVPNDRFRCFDNRRGGGGGECDENSSVLKNCANGQVVLLSL